MINNFPFFRFPFYPYPRHYSRNIQNRVDNPNIQQKNENITQNYNRATRCDNEQKKTSKYNHIGPILINTNGFSNKEESLIEFCNLKLYLDDIIILSLLFFLYKEDVKDDMLFILLILLLIG